MAGTHHFLAQLLALAGLIGGTIEYIEILKRRAAARRRKADDDAAADSGLRAMIRVFLTDRDER